jgi:hypothetical protein
VQADRISSARPPRHAQRRRLASSDLHLVGLDGDELVSGHLSSRQRKLRNVRRNPRVSISIEETATQGPRMKEYLVVHGSARVEEAAAPSSFSESRRSSSAQM